MGGVCGEWVGDWTRVWRGGVMSAWAVSLDSLCRWQAQVSVYCPWRIPAHLRCTQYPDDCFSFLLKTTAVLYVQDSNLQFQCLQGKFQLDRLNSSHS